MKLFASAVRTLCAAALILAAVSCGHGDSFRVKGTITDGSSINLRFVYMTGNAVHTALTASTDGKFAFEAATTGPAAVEVYDNEYRLLGRFVARNGDDIDLRIDRSNRFLNVAKGNDMNRELTEFYNSLADSLVVADASVRNAIVARYAALHTDSPVARLLVSTEFDASTDDAALLCDSLMRSFAPETQLFDVAEPFALLAAQVASASTREPVQAITYKQRGNRTATFTPGRSPLTVIAMSDAANGHDSVVAAFRRLAKHSKNGLELLDLSFDADTAMWVRTIRNDSADWTQGWVAGAISGQSVERLGIPSVPYFIVVDSAGTQLWRGRSAEAAVSRAIENIKP